MQDSDILGFTRDALNATGGYDTATEIQQQPALWEKTWRLVSDRQDDIRAFLEDARGTVNADFIFSGAGTSAFIGNSLEVLYYRNLGVTARAVATTDLVTHPRHWLQSDAPTCLVSFARSGDSPESVASVNLANQVCDDIQHIIITCNENGSLAREANSDNTLVLLLPPETNDKSLAMTGSYTSMLLTGILLSHIDHLDTMEEEVARLCRYGQQMLDTGIAQLRQVCELPFERAVFLGSGPLQGCAEECHLKLQELTDGAVISKFDSFMGFRHGPKAVINPATLMTYLLSSDPYVQQYEQDLLQAINAGERGIYRIGVTEQVVPALDLDLQLVLNDEDDGRINADFLPVCDTLAGQLLGFYKSLNLGLNPDAPSESGTISRVVQGVTIYSYNT